MATNLKQAFIAAGRRTLGANKFRSGTTGKSHRREAFYVKNSYGGSWVEQAVCESAR
jgi:hypothetical protein